MLNNQGLYFILRCNFFYVLIVDLLSLSTHKKSEVAVYINVGIHHISKTI